MTLPPEQEAIRAKCFHPSGTFVEFPMEDVETSIPERFEKIVEHYPNRLAVKTKNCELTYSQVNEAANRVGRAILTARGANPEAVALMFEQGASSICAILGVLKAGKFYVPLDPSAPTNRIKAILAHSTASLVITNTHNLAMANLTAGDRCTVINIDDLADKPVAENPQLSLSADALAYLVYTSGSTGEPKGIIETHRYALYHVFEYVNSFRLCPSDRVTLVFPWFFSGGIHLIHGTLLSGAALFPIDVKADGLNHLARLLVEEKITIYHSTAATLRHTLSLLDREEKLPSLRLVRFGGDSVSAADIQLYKNNFSQDCLLLNTFATTESGVVCRYFFDKDTRVADNHVPAGYPAYGKEVLLLDDDGNALGSDQIGEIAVKSRYLSVGYWQQPNLTAAKFITDQNNRDERIYLTGDLGRITPDGCLYHLGRKDFQVKVRGYRVDSAEVEMALLQHDNIKEVAVVGRSDQLGNSRLVAYFVPADQFETNVSALRQFLSQRLPDYMIPSLFVLLQSLPLTPNGKVDRRALPEPGDERPELGSVFVAPQDDRQRGLVRIWEKLLGVRPIGVRDSFFDLGGHSLAAVQLVAEIEKAFKKRLAPAALFQAPTIEQLAEIIRRGPESWSSLVPLQTNGTKLPFFWIHGDFSNAFLPRYLGTDQPLYGLEHQSQDGKPARYASVESIAANYLREIRSVQAPGPYSLGGYSFGSIVALEIAQQLKDQAQEVALLALLDPPRPFEINDKSSTRLNHGRSSTNWFHSRLDRHYTNIKSLGYKGGLAYLWERGAGKINEVRSSVSTKVSNGLKRALIKICLARGRDLPSSVRSRYILDLYHRIRPQYEMRPYAGRVVLFKGDDQSDEYVGDWEPYLVGEKQIYQVPGHHMELREETYIRGWAEHLKACLEAAQVIETPSGRKSETARTRNPAVYSVAK